MPFTTPAKRRRLLAICERHPLSDEGRGWPEAECGVSFVIGPNLKEFTAHTGRAPIVKMSRTMPPTPVAAPWNGSTALG